MGKLLHDIPIKRGIVRTERHLLVSGDVVGCLGSEGRRLNTINRNEREGF